jgi:hypothetical protein
MISSNQTEPCAFLLAFEPGGNQETSFHNTIVLFLDSNSQLSTKFDVIYTDYCLEIYI